MQHINDLDLLNHLRAFADYDANPMVVDTSLPYQGSLNFDFGSIQRRERIDSEDFQLAFASKGANEFEFFTLDSFGGRFGTGEELRPRRKSSIILMPDPTLIELEVSLQAVHF